RSRRPARTPAAGFPPAAPGRRRWSGRSRCTGPRGRRTGGSVRRRTAPPPPQSPTGRPRRPYGCASPRSGRLCAVRTGCCHQPRPFPPTPVPRGPWYREVYGSPWRPMCSQRPQEALMEHEERSAILKEADALYARGKLEEALELYRRVLAEDDTVAWAHSRTGAILAQLGDLDAAEAHLRRAIELDPKLP